MILKHPLSIFLFFISCFLFFSSCKKDSFISSKDASLSTSVDSLKYDTVFTQTGSITQTFKINNSNDQKLLLSKVQLMGGSTSSYKININGIAGPEADNISIDANDSIYVFVTVTINPNSTNLPFIVSDSILISYNGNNKFVQLQAYGQNAHFINSKIIKSDTTWTNDLPYVILGGVEVDTPATLTIEKGCRIYSHADAPFLVNGTLIVNGAKQDSVVFTGDRLDADYKDLPASWPGIYFFSTSTNNVLTHTVIKNAYQAIVVDSASTNSSPKITLHQCIIDNAYDAGILCYNTSLNIDNSLISNCGSNIELTYGGNYNFTNCTVASYGNLYITHKNPVLQAYNFDGTTGLTTALNANFINCIFWGDGGNVDDEVIVTEKNNTTPDVTFSHCLYKVKTDPVNCTLTSIIKNQPPLFDSIDVNKRIFNFHISNTAAPGFDFGAGISFLSDLDDNTRTVGVAPDLGCYEKQ